MDALRNVCERDNHRIQRQQIAVRLRVKSDICVCLVIVGHYRRIE